MSSDKEDYGSDEDDDDDDEDESPVRIKGGSSKKRKGSNSKSGSSKPKKSKTSFIDDSAELSGSDVGSEDDDDEDEEGDNDYERDDFLVDDVDEEEEELPRRRGNDDDLVDSDDDDDDESDDDDEEVQKRRRQKLAGRIKSRIRKKKEELDEDDMLLIREAAGEDVYEETLEKQRREASAAAARNEAKRKTLMAQSERELQKQLFDEEGGGGGKGPRKGGKKGSKGKQGLGRKPIRGGIHDDEQFDEDDIDDFIEDDLGEREGRGGRDQRSGGGGSQWDLDGGLEDDYDDDGGGMMGMGGGGGGGISEAQWSEANEIFGMDYMNMMSGGGEGAGDDDEEGGGSESLKALKKKRRRKKDRYREEGVNVDGAGESEDDSEDESEDDEPDEDDLFPSDDDDDDDDPTKQKRREEASKRREEREKFRRERRQRRLQQKVEKKRTALRRAYEPIVLIENFCTPKDDEIRSQDIPERYQVSKILDMLDECVSGTTEETDGGEGGTANNEEEMAMWIMSKVPAIASEFFSTSATTDDGSDMDVDDSTSGGGSTTPLTSKQRRILKSITCAINFMRVEKLEPEFLRKYREDYIESSSVRNHLYDILDQISEYNKLLFLRRKAANLISNFSKNIIKMNGIIGSSSSGSNGGTTTNAVSAKDASKEEELMIAREKLEKAVEQEATAEEDLKKFLEENKDLEKDKSKKANDDDEEEDKDDLFGGDDEEDEEDEDTDKKERKQHLSKLKAHYATVKDLVTERAEKVATLSAQVASSSSSNNNDNGDGTAGANSTDTDRMASLAVVLNSKMSTLQLYNEENYKQYLSTLTEHRQITDVIEYLQLINEGHDALILKSNKYFRHMLLGEGDGDNEDYDNNSKGGRTKKGSLTTKAATRRSKRFDRDYYRTCVSDGLRQVSYQFLLSPIVAGTKLEQDTQFGSSLSYNNSLTVGTSGPPKIDIEPDQFVLNLISNGELKVINNNNDSNANADPLAGCRYVGAMELAYEPRIRTLMRQLYRQQAVLTSKPTKKGLSSIDTFHEYYGLHLIKEKPIRDHFADAQLLYMQQQGRSSYNTDRHDMEDELRRIEKESCLQFLRMTKAERAGFIQIKVHLPNPSILHTGSDDWYKEDMKDPIWNSNISSLMDVLERVTIGSSLSSTLLSSLTETERLWYDERQKVLKQALVSFMLPQFEIELIRDLMISSIKFGVADTSENLKQLALEGPYRPTHMMGENRFIVPTGKLSLVGVCVSQDNRNDATYLACVSSRGELKSSLAIPAGKHITNPQMRDKVLQFLISNRPAAVLVGVTSGGLQSRLMSRKLQEIISEATEKWNNRYVQGEDEDDDEYDTRTREFRQKYMMSGSSGASSAAAAAADDDDDDEDDVWKCNVDLVDDNVAQLFGRSVRSTREFPDITQTNLKCAIAIARYGQDPLNELCYTWSVASDSGIFGTEMLYINIHPLQSILPKQLLLKSYERILCYSVSEVGVDVNASCIYKHQHGLLQFVPGLGPRKAANLKQNVARLGGIVPSRKYLLTKRLLGPNIYINCVAFLRITDSGTEQLSGRHLHPLDNTRVHPDVYITNNYALKIAVDAIEAQITDGDEDEYLQAVRRVMNDSKKQIKPLYDETKRQWEQAYGTLTFNISGWDPHNIPPDHWRDKVEELDLDTFAEMIEENTSVKMLSHLIMIKWEFRLPFSDPRKPMEPLGGDKLFRLLTGESDWSLRPGKEVTGTIIRNSDFGSRVKLEGDIPGFLALRNMSDDQHVQACEEVVSENTVITAIVTNVKKEPNISIDVSIKLSDFRKKTSDWTRPESLPPIDKYFDYMAESKLDILKQKERDAHIASIEAMTNKNRADASGYGSSSSTTTAGSKAKDTSVVVSRRTCAHPCFRNLKNDEVNKELLGDDGDGMVGEALIRPSTKTADSLALHWLVRPGVIRVVEVHEEDKDTDASIGNVLKIKDETYTSIDEILGRYISPMNDRAEEVRCHRKFLSEKTEDDVDEMLIELKKKQPSGVFYYLCWNERYPGYISLHYILGQTPRTHIIGIIPDGYMWGKMKYTNLDRLLNDFKKNPRGPGGIASSGSTGSGTGSRPAPPSKPISSNSTITSQSSSTTMSTSASSNTSHHHRPSRWGAPRPPPPRPPQQTQQPAPPPSRPAIPVASTGWGASTTSPASPVAPATGWGAPSSSRHSGAGSSSSSSSSSTTSAIPSTGVPPPHTMPPMPVPVPPGYPSQTNLRPPPPPHPPSSRYPPPPPPPPSTVYHQ